MASDLETIDISTIFSKAQKASQQNLKKNISDLYESPLSEDKSKHM